MKIVKWGAERAQKRISVRLSAPVFVSAKRVKTVGQVKRRALVFGGRKPADLYQDKRTSNSHFKFLGQIISRFCRVYRFYCPPVRLYNFAR